MLNLLVFLFTNVFTLDVPFTSIYHLSVLSYEFLHVGRRRGVESKAVSLEAHQKLLESNAEARRKRGAEQSRNGGEGMSRRRTPRRNNSYA